MEFFIEILRVIVIMSLFLLKVFIVFLSMLLVFMIVDYKPKEYSKFLFRVFFASIATTIVATIVALIINF